MDLRPEAEWDIEMRNNEIFFTDLDMGERTPVRDKIAALFDECDRLRADLNRALYNGANLSDRARVLEKERDERDRIHGAL